MTPRRGVQWVWPPGKRTGPSTSSLSCSFLLKLCVLSAGRASREGSAAGCRRPTTMPPCPQPGWPSYVALAVPPDDPPVSARERAAVGLAAPLQQAQQAWQVLVPLGPRPRPRPRLKPRRELGRCVVSECSYLSPACEAQGTTRCRITYKGCASTAAEDKTFPPPPRCRCGEVTRPGMWCDCCDRRGRVCRSRPHRSSRQGRRWLRGPCRCSLSCSPRWGCQLPGMIQPASLGSAAELGAETARIARPATVRRADFHFKLCCGPLHDGLFALVVVAGSRVAL
jgi:hypothetical protein